MDSPPQYLIMGGLVFDEILSAPDEVQLRFLKLLSVLRRDPEASDVLDIEPDRVFGQGLFMAALEGLDVSYHVVDDDQVPRVVLISVLWV